MRWRDHWAVVLALLGAAPAGAASPAEPAYRYHAPIEVQRPGTFVQLPLPPSVYARAAQAGLADLRIVDARGERVPFAFLPPQVESTPSARDAKLFPLPRQRVASGEWALPVTVRIQGHEIQVQPPAASGPLIETHPPGWLFDLGEPSANATAPAASPRALVLAWSGPTEFSAPYDLQTSSDLRQWRSAESGQLMALTASQGVLTQPQVLLSTQAPRFVRLIWRDAATAPQLTAARVVFDPPVSVAQEALSWQEITPTEVPQDAAHPHALYFDLGGPVPVTQIDLDMGRGTRVLPLQIEGRAAPDQPWRSLAQGVVYRLEHDGRVSRSPPLALSTSMRYLRLLPDPRAAAPPRDGLRLRVQMRHPRLVFATQGQPPFSLHAGAAQAPAGALPAAVLVPALDDERHRFGEALLGEWVEAPGVAREIEAAERRAAWRPWLLWAVLLAGVAGLGAMVWRLRRMG